MSALPPIATAKAKFRVAGPRDHPLLKHELAARSFVVRTLQRLGLNMEAVKPTGRPPHGIGWQPDADN
jgi:hypothetical protein